MCMEFEIIKCVFEECKIVDCVKGIVMKVCGLGEEEVYVFLCKIVMD